MKKRYQGRIGMYNHERGFGFVQSDSFEEPLWFHYTHIDGSDNSALYAELYARTDLHTIQVSFELGTEDPRGLQARRIRPLGPYPEIEDLLRFSSLTEVGAKQEFLDLISIPALAYIDSDATLTQLAVSRVVRSARTWDTLASMARLWLRATGLFQKAPVWSVDDRQALASFSRSLAGWLRFETEHVPEYNPSLHTVIQPLPRIDSPLRCFRQAGAASIAIVPHVRVISEIVRRDRSLIVADSGCFRMVIVLDEGGGLIDEIEKAFGLTIIRQRALIETLMGSDEQRPVIIGRSFRAILPPHQLQPYEVGSAYDEAIYAGRTQERQRILEHIIGNHAVYGGRKIGKTWFLKDICKQCDKEPHSSAYVAIYVSLQSAESVEDGASLIEDAVSFRLERAASKDTDAMSRLRRLLLRMHKTTGKTVLLALDEIDDVLKLDDHYRLFGRLRQLQQTYPGAFKYVFAGFKELIRSLSDLTSNNPFANWIGKNHFPLGCLVEEDLQTLIVEPLRWVGLDFQPDEIVEKIFELTSGHPYYVQSLCHSIVRKRLQQNAKTLTPENIESLASEEFFSEVFDIFIANLSPLQLLIGKILADRDGPFLEEEVADALLGRFGIEITQKQLLEEMKVLQSCSVLTRSVEGYRPVMQRLNQEFFQRQDDIALALHHMEQSDGTRNSSRA